MLRNAALSAFAFAATVVSAGAHTGHIAVEGGHDHGVAYAAAGLAIIIAAGAAAWLQARR